MNQQEYIRQIMLAEQDAQADLSKKLNQQHYKFAHKLMPYMSENYFDKLVSEVLDNGLQNWVLQVWSSCADESMLNYCKVVYPKCQFIKPSDELGLIYFVMPAPRVTTEAAYIAIIFLIDDDEPSEWLRSYFTLELGAFNSWILGEWDDSTHINRGNFQSEPTLENFLATIVAEGQSRWC